MTFVINLLCKDEQQNLNAVLKAAITALMVAIALTKKDPFSSLERAAVVQVVAIKNKSTLLRVIFYASYPVTLAAAITNVVFGVNRYLSSRKC